MSDNQFMPNNESNIFVIRTDNQHQLSEISQHFNKSPVFQDSSSESIQNSKNKTKIKTKPIKKQVDSSENNKKKKGNKKNIIKRIVDQNIQSTMGRPYNKQTQERHLIINKSFNDIVYHLCRYLIFLKIWHQEQQIINRQIQFGSKLQQLWVENANNMMNQDNYPKFQDIKPDFLLHPNSPHFIFQQNKKNQKLSYCKNEVKFILYAFLKKKNLFSQRTFNYINSYWEDIIHLVNNPQDQNAIQNGPQDHEFAIHEFQQEDHDKSKDIKEGKKKKGIVSKEENEIQMMKKQLEDDETIIAYEIACYLHSCCEKFHMKITG